MRLELRPSRHLAAALAGIGILGAFGAFLTNLPVTAAIALAACAIAWGLMLARRTLQHAPLHLVLRGDGSVHVNDAAVDDVSIHWQGPLTCLRWRAGARTVRVVAWPDVLDAAARRELRLWTLAHRADASTAPVAP